MQGETSQGGDVSQVERQTTEFVVAEVETDETQMGERVVGQVGEGVGAEVECSQGDEGADGGGQGGEGVDGEIELAQGGPELGEFDGQGGESIVGEEEDLEGQPAERGGKLAQLVPAEVEEAQRTKREEDFGRDGSNGVPAQIQLLQPAPLRNLRRHST